VAEPTEPPPGGHPIWQEGVLAGAFLLLVVLGVATVVLPALEDAQDPAPAAGDAGVSNPTE
jgi:hypothetical protein